MIGNAECAHARDGHRPVVHIGVCVATVLGILVAGVPAAAEPPPPTISARVDDPAWEPEFTEPRPLEDAAVDEAGTPSDEAPAVAPGEESEGQTSPTAGGTPPPETPPVPGETSSPAPTADMSQSDAEDAPAPTSTTAPTAGPSSTSTPTPTATSGSPEDDRADHRPEAGPTAKADPTATPTAKPKPTARPTADAEPRATAKAKAPAKTSSAASSREAEVLATAKDLSGIPYVWGGTTTRGFDCSGYVQHVFGKAGVRLPRTAAQQQQATRRVSTPRPGDLVFFGSPAHHVGIYAGEGRMWDAPRRGKTTGLHTIWSKNVTYGRP